MHFQWYPGHMTKAKRMMQENIKLIDLVIELVDARVPISSRNPDIDELGKNKARLILLNKSDLAEDKWNDAWSEYFREKGFSVVKVNSKKGGGIKSINGVIQEACKEKIERDRKRGILNRPVRAMVVGIPNVGKSTLFNVIAGDSIAIVKDTPGVTRDRIYAKASWLTKEFSVIDTGGIELENASFTTQIKMQAEIAIEEADVIVFVVNGREGITKEDEYVARLLQKSRKPIILVVNKIDDNQFRDYIYEFYALGVGDPIPVSGSHGIGIGDLLDQIINQLDLQDEETNEDEISFSIIGRPNVGKSSLTNAILGEERVIVSNIEGTTRDAIDTPFVKDGQKYRVVDTAGMRKKGKVYENIEKYSILRALTSIEKSDVILVVIDGETGIREQDKHVAGYAHEAGKGVVIVYNKWDLVDKDEKTMQKKQKEIYEQFKYLDYARIVFTSAKTGQRVDQIFPLIQESYENSRKRVQTSVLNDVLVDAQLMNPTTTFNGGRLKIFYANQVAVCPPTFVLFSNDPQYLHFSYKRYLENRLREAFGFEGTPIHIICRKRD